MATLAVDRQGGMCQHPVTSNIEYQQDLKEQGVLGIQVAEEHQETCSGTPGRRQSSRKQKLLRCMHGLH